jgi:hypothetical protein
MAAQLAELRHLRSAVLSFASGFMVEDLVGDEIHAALGDAAQIEKSASILTSMVASRLAHETPPGASERPEDTVAKARGTTSAQAKETIATGSRLGELSQSSAAGRAGELSSAQAALVARGAAADPGQETRLLSMATRVSLAELRDEVARVVARADSDPTARYERLRSKRFLRTHTDVDGAWHLHVMNTPDVGARIMGALRPIAERLFHQARRENRPEPPGAYAADALTEAVCGPSAPPPASAPATEPPTAEPPTAEPTTSEPTTSEPTTSEPTTSEPTTSEPTTSEPTTAEPAPTPASKAPSTTAPKFIVRLDETLLRQRETSGALYDIPGYGQVPLSVVQDLMATENPFWTAILVRGKDVATVAHLGRSPNAYQLTALQWLYPTCAVEGCPRRLGVEWDHEEDWAKVKKTGLGNLQGLCHYHHRLKTAKGWDFTDGTATGAFVSPEDPRHPRHRGPGQARAGP